MIKDDLFAQGIHFYHDRNVIEDKMTLVGQINQFFDPTETYRGFHRSAGLEKMVIESVRDANKVIKNQGSTGYFCDYAQQLCGALSRKWGGIMDQRPPSQEEIRDAFINAPGFIWPEFAAMPLNCFDLKTALLTFPGDISKSRSDPFSDCADFQVDINDLNTCPRIDSFFEKERWNESSLFVWWYLGRFHWTCSPGAVRQFSVTQGFFTTYINVTRFQNMEEVSDITQPFQLKTALYKSLIGKIEKGFIKPITPDSIFEKSINGRVWVIARSFDPCDNPTYEVASAIDHRTAIDLAIKLDNSWFSDETIPNEVEQKHLASLWDYLSHVTIHPAGSNHLEAGTFYRETPGQAEKVEEDKFEW